MDNKLISEITKIQSMMGILVEQEQPLEPLVSGDLTIKFTNFNPGNSTWDKNKVYVNGVSDKDLIKLKELHLSNNNSKVILKNIHTNEVFTFPNKVMEITSNNKVRISDSEYSKIKTELETNEIQLNKDFLKKMESGFPDFMIKTMREVYPNNWGKNSFTDSEGICNTEEGLINIGDTNVPGQTWSILNYFDTNPKVIEELINWFYGGMFNNDETPLKSSIQDFEKWIYNNREEIFKGSNLDKLVSLNRRSYENGIKSENSTITKLTESPFNIPRENIKQYCSGSKEDRFEAKDLMIETPEGNKHIQIKPLEWFKIDENTGEYIVKTYYMKNYKGYLKRYGLDYVAFINNKNLLVFDNKDYVLDGYHYVKFKNKPIEKI
jgi:hypothetical protein